jgi:hypothetical protein
MKEAKLEAERATRIAPDYPRVWHVLGGVEFEEGNTEAAKAAYDRQLELAPHDLDAILDRAALAIDIQEYDYGQELAARVIGTDREGDGWHCRAIIAYRQGGHEEAIQLYDIAIARGCNDVPVTRWNKSLALHSLGRYREGWIDHEQRKFQKKDSALAMPARRFILPMWNHEPPPAQIHVHPEAGMGDNICLSRYLNLLTDQGYDVSFEVHDDLYDLMKLSFPKVNVVHKAPDYPAALGIPLFDYHIPTGSLPAVFQTEVDTVPWSGPFLRADPEKVEHYRKLVPPGSVGIVWSSGIRPGAWITTYGQMKSMKLADMEPLMKLGRTLVSLQVGPERAELANYPNVLDVLPAKPTWADTAALIECLRGVVTVDTGVSHLAGGMGMPVMLTMHCHGSWHYLADRPGTFWQTRSPWYPATALYRQSRSFHWDDVIQRISADIEADHWLTPAKLENAA